MMDKANQTDMPTKYDPQATEAKWYPYWTEGEFFKAEGKGDKEPYTIVIPPPNVTGRLHLGHAWDTTLQDIISRLKRMQGYDMLWLPGMDHAGIATQAKVEGKLKEEEQTVMKWDGKHSWRNPGNGKKSMQILSGSSGPRLVFPSIIRESGLLWIKDCPMRCVKYSLLFIIKG